MEDGDGETFQMEDSVIRRIVGCPAEQVTENVLQPDSDGTTLTPFQSLAVKNEKCGTPSNCLVNTASGNLSALEIVVPKVKVNGDVNSSKCCETICDLNDSDNDAAHSSGDMIHSPISTLGLSQLETVNKDVPIRGKKRKIFEKSSLPIKLTDDTSSIGDNVELKSPKKRRLVHTMSPTDSVKGIDPVSSTHADKGIVVIKKGSPGKLKKKADEPSTPQAEYAQYLGLQPTVKFKCCRCAETGFPSMHKLQEHQHVCLNNVKLQPLPKSILPRLPTDPSPSTNFRITRKVYLCSSCGTYYENWNLFLHMREVHKRHVCLFCLTMFNQAERLAAHLISKHGITEVFYTSSEHLFSEISGSCFLMCISCETVFTERDDFSNHVCTAVLRNADKLCSLCNLRGTHLPTCHLASSTSHHSPIEFTGKPHLIPAHSSKNVPKYLIPIAPVPQPLKKKKEESVIQSSLGKNNELSDTDDDYDISNAASFCHVNIHEPQEKQISVTRPTEQKESTSAVAIPQPPTIDTSSTGSPSELSKAEDCISEQSEETVNTPKESNYELESTLTSLKIDLETCETQQEKLCPSLQDELVSLPTKSPDPISTEIENPNPSPEIAKVTENVDIPPETIPESCGNSTQIDEPLPTDNVTPVQQTEEASSSSESSLSVVIASRSDLCAPSSPSIESLPKVFDEGAVNNMTPLLSDKESCELSQTDASLASSSPTQAVIPIEDTEEPNVTNIVSPSLPVEDPTIVATTVTATESENGDELVINMSKRSTSIRPPAAKRTRRRRANFKSRPSRAKPKPRKPEVTAPIKTPLTLKFIKTSSTANANYRTAIDGNLLEFDNSDYDTNIVDPMSSPDSSGRPEDLIQDLEAEAMAAKLAEEQAFLESIQLAGDDVPSVEIYFEEMLESLTIQELLRECVKTVCSSCVYCGHAKKIAVNGKQLALHLLAEHRFVPVYKKESSFNDNLTVDVPSLPPSNEESSKEEDKDGTDPIHDLCEELSKEMVSKLKAAVSGLQELFLNTETYDSSDRSFMHPYDRTYECFQCNFLTTLHKDLYVHNRKMHQKTILLCIMCKTNFYSYSELLCHLCPGIYIPDNEIKFRCCVCVVDSLPSAFRLMVHLRKRHNCCDVCLEVTDDQQKLSNHVWKHKLHHLCYRCGIAYRNKPDITKHLFWKHGTESVLCKKCLQKKWPHVYHFCIPPNAFICEECNTSFSRAVSLKVHKRLHSGDLLYGCEECEERFVSKKLLAKHQDTHREVPVVDAPVDDQDVKNPINMNVDQTVTTNQETEPTLVINGDNSPENKEHLKVQLEVPLAEEKKQKHVRKQSSKKSKAKVVDVYDLPPLNLSSESDDSDDEREKQQTQINLLPETEVKLQLELDHSNHKIDDVLNTDEENHQPVQTVDGVWDNFQNYKANLERRESQSNESAHNPFASLPFPLCSMDPAEAVSIVMGDHDYCGDTELKQAESTSAGPSSMHLSLDDLKQVSAINLNSSLDHDYCCNQSTPSSLSKNEVPKAEEQPTVNPAPAQSHSSTQSKESPVKKKQKSARKDKRTMSSSSSDSSSSSSSSCSCKTNCSCSSSSSSSSGSSSDSSESDSSTSEGRRLQIARRQQRREARKKKTKDDNAAVLPTEVDKVAEQTDIPAEPEVVEEPIRESDLETDETETDEDFYDQHPQLLANKLLAEKRNQLLLLAAVAPGDHIMTPPESLPPPSPEPNLIKKKNKSKKRKKHQHDSDRKAASRMKINTTSGYYIHQTTPNPIQPPIIYSLSPNSQSQQPSNQSYIPSHHRAVEQTTPTPAAFSAESGSETDSKRLSKRRRLPKKFYGDSSDEDSTTQPKWPLSTPLVNSSPAAQSVPPSPGYVSPIPPPPAPVQARVPPMIIVPGRAEPDDEDDDNLADSESEQEEVKKSSSDSSSNSEPERDDSDTQTTHRTFIPPPIEHVPGGQRNDNLYCYCQCPYDEVSEMIACDGKDCLIEWFHFECVGIMVPPRGKWFCPDCRKASTAKTW